MSSRNSPTLTLEVNGRRAEALAAWLVLAAAGCTIQLFGATHFWLQGLAGAAVGAIAVGLWRAGWIGSRHRIVGVRWLADGRWSLTDSQGTATRAELSGHTRLTGSALWLRWDTTPGRPRSMLLFRGDMPAGQLRSLRVRLRIQALERALPDAPAR
jgi:hypothetical protein